MTIAAAYLTSEGVVMGADSTTTILSPKGVLQLLNHAQKVFEVGPPGSRVGLCTWGAGRLGELSHRTVSALLGDGLQAGTTIADVTAALVSLAAAEASKPGVSVGPVGYFIGGIEPKTRQPSCMRIMFKADGSLESVMPLDIGAAVFEGVPDLFIRAFQGFDPTFLVNLKDELKKRLPSPPADFDTLFDDAATVAHASIPHGGFTDIPIREAIDFVNMYLHLTIKTHKFRFAPPICGGQIEIGFITTDRCFRWARHKRHDSAVVHEDAGEL